jgi:asparagine synthase (glutamine-hydrolysing)
MEPAWRLLPKSRNNALTNKFRQLHRFARGLQVPPRDRYWTWAALMDEQHALRLLHPSIRERIHPGHQLIWQNKIFPPDLPDDDFNRMLLADMKLVLPDDMLKKADMMSMAHGLEMRVPFLDHELVNYVFTLPVHSKITGDMKKRILRDAFRDMLPPELYRRPKHGFEVPLLKWFRTGLRSLIENDLLSDHFVESQGIFDPQSIRKLKKRLFSLNPGDVHAHIWALIVFQWWWKKYIKS